MGIKHKLLDTPAERVPHEFAQSVIDFVKPIDVQTLDAALRAFGPQRT